jgi:hypothetical protein
MVHGAFHGGDRGAAQTGPLRPVPGRASHRMPAAGLYQTGATIRPGGSVTGAPGPNAAIVLLHDQGHDPTEVMSTLTGPRGGRIQPARLTGPPAGCRPDRVTAPRGAPAGLARRAAITRQAARKPDHRPRQMARQAKRDIRRSGPASCRLAATVHGVQIGVICTPALNCRQGT